MHVCFRGAGGGLQPVPTALFAFFGSPLMQGVLPAMWRDLRTRRSLHAALSSSGDAIDDDESLEAFFTRRFSPGIAARLIDPMLSGIYAGDISQLSVQAVFPLLARLEREHGSVLMGTIAEAMKRGKDAKAAGDGGGALSPEVAAVKRAASVSFVGGMSTFPAALRRRAEVGQGGDVCGREEGRGELLARG